MIKDKTDQELRNILLTVDGMGRVAKEEALNELLERRYHSVANNISANTYTLDGFNGWKS
jgi:hypothetical protein